MAMERVVRNSELKELGIERPHRLEVPVSSEILLQLKAYYHKSKGCRTIFANTEELLIGLPSQAEILYYQQEVASV
jgi:hypothetical protein